MRIINIIVTDKHSSVNSVDSFAVVDEQLSKEVIEEAQQSFIRKIINIAFDDPNTEEADYLREALPEFFDHGSYTVNDKTISIVWSYIME